MAGLTDTINRAAVLAELRNNAIRRGHAACELEASRQQLADLLRKGRERKVPVAKMCEAAGINRERAYEFLRGEKPPKSRDTYINEGEVK
jgi:hypothetical protein